MGERSIQVTSKTCERMLEQGNILSANLSINEITRESKEYRAELLVDKIFEVGKTNS